MKRSYVIFGSTLALALGTYVLRAQIFNLEDEDAYERVPSSALTPQKAKPAQEIVSAAKLPEDKEDTEKLNKLYADIVKELKANNVEAATKIMSKHDVITKQKIVDRLLKEDPADFAQPAQGRPVTIPDAAFDQSEN